MGKKGQPNRRQRVQRLSQGEIRGEIRRLNEQLAALNLRVRDVEGDGNCLFRSVADQMYGKPDGHRAVRKETMDFIQAHAEMFAPFIEDDESFEDYCDRMRKPAEWGGNIEIQAISLLYSYDVIIHAIDQPRMEVRNPGTKDVMHLSYLQGEHYGSARYTADTDPDKMARIWKRTTSGSSTDKPSSPTVTSNKGKKGRKDRSSKHDPNFVPPALVNQVKDQLDEPIPPDHQIEEAIRSCNFDCNVAVLYLYSVAAEHDQLQDDEDQWRTLQNRLDQEEEDMIQTAQALSLCTTDAGRVDLSDDDDVPWINQRNFATTTTTTTTTTRKECKENTKEQKQQEKEEKERAKREKNLEKMQTRHAPKMSKQQKKREKAKEKAAIKEAGGAESYDVAQEIMATSGVAI
eukprot:TRINITY_DN65827_c3_g2_i1.p1 TRINITY_DN65827_c3_g2~~TRINITY_DN65827_c3_g2_i1.p1  ORF type:complete len:424 (+),score=48.97 TRINITY_DN65827_c3_g2_i1:66-1274(+)